MKLSNPKFFVSVASTYTYPKMMYFPEILRLGFFKYSVSKRAHMEIGFIYSGFGL